MAGEKNEWIYHCPLIKHRTARTIQVSICAEFLNVYSFTVYILWALSRIAADSMNYSSNIWLFCARKTWMHHDIKYRHLGNTTEQFITIFIWIMNTSCLWIGTFAQSKFLIKKIRWENTITSAVIIWWSSVWNLFRFKFQFWLFEAIGFLVLEMSNLWFKIIVVVWCIWSFDNLQ